MSDDLLSHRRSPDRPRGRPKVVHLTSAHASRDTRIFQKQCRSLAAAGYQVVLLAQNEQGEEAVNGVTIRGLHAPANRRERMTKTARRVLQLALEEDADLYHFHDPELVPVGLVLKAAGHSVIWDVHEDLPRQVLSKEWIPRLLRGPVSRAAKLGEKAVVGAFDAVVAATPSIANRLPGSQAVVVNNYPRLADLGSDSVNGEVNRDLTVVYTGNITRIRGIDQVVEALGPVAERTGVRLSLAGRFSPPDLYDSMKKRPEWQHVDFHGWLSQQDLFALLRRSLAGLVLFQPVPNHVESQPNKLFEYMGAGLPIIASAFPLWRKLIVEEIQCGIVVDPTEPEEIAKAVEWVVRHPSEAREMGRRGEDAVRSRFNWESEQTTLLRLYSEILEAA